MLALAAVSDDDDELREFIATQIRMAWLDDGQIVDEAVAAYPEIPVEAVRDEVRVQSAAHEADERTWATPTEVERLEKVFATLEAAGYIPGWNVGRSWREATAEIKRLAGTKFPNARRFVMFPDSELENAATYGILRLSYGDLKDDAEAAQLAAASELLETLVAAELRATWAGTVDAYVRIELDWKARRRNRRSS